MNATSPKSSLAKLGIHTKQKPLRIMVLGCSGVGKTGKKILNIIDIKKISYSDCRLK